MSKLKTHLEALETTFQALAHPSRRQILLILQFRGGEMTAGEIAARFSCSWPTTTRHLKVLEEAGVLDVTREGRERYYRLDARRLVAVRQWLAHFDPTTGKGHVPRTPRAQRSKGTSPSSKSP